MQAACLQLPEVVLAEASAKIEAQRRRPVKGAPR